MHEAARELLDAFIAQDDARPRSQSGFGVSLLGGCARRAYYEMNGAPKTNPTKRLSAILGTIFHAGVEALGLPGYTELEVEWKGQEPITGHVDRWHKGVVTDWKFPKLASLSYTRRYGPSRQYQWQVHTYAWLLEMTQNLHSHTVRIVFVPRDGHDDDIYVWEEPYRQAVAVEALAWMHGILTADRQGKIPLPEKPEPFCRDFCPFYGEMCQGVSTASDAPEHDDPWIEAAARELLEATEERKAAEQKKYDAAAILEDAVGRYGPYEVSWKRSSAGTYYPVVKRIARNDEDATRSE